MKGRLCTIPVEASGERVRQIRLYRAVGIDAYIVTVMVGLIDIVYDRVEQSATTRATRRRRRETKEQLQYEERTSTNVASGVRVVLTLPMNVFVCK